MIIQMLFLLESN
jgi:hypothetical protein